MFRRFHRAMRRTACSGPARRVPAVMARVRVSWWGPRGAKRLPLADARFAEPDSGEVVIDPDLPPTCAAPGFVFQSFRPFWRTVADNVVPAEIQAVAHSCASCARDYLRLVGLEDSSTLSARAFGGMQQRWAGAGASFAADPADGRAVRRPDNPGIRKRSWSIWSSLASRRLVTPVLTRRCFGRPSS
jgi:hypothetical protein